MEKIGTSKDGHVDFVSFVKYVLNHEKRLKLSFSALDRDKDGVLNEQEVISAFRQLGVHIDTAEAQRLMKQ